MNHLDIFVTTGWLLVLVFTAATLVVAVLRKACRTALGSGRAFLLWLLPPAAMVASLLPHAQTQARSLPAIVVAITTLPGAASPAMHAGSGGWRSWIAVLWLAGVIVTALLAAYAQWRYRARLRGAAPCDGIPSRWPVLRAVAPDIGPALVGAWHSRIVLPADFDSRYDKAEQRLILAHETMHARRRDGLWCLVAQIIAVALWFHPLAWWALSAFRRDEEMACDAAVLSEHRGCQRCYGNAMLKAASAAFPLPVGCAWSSRHPLAERITMLKQPQPGRVRHGGGIALMVAVTLLGAGCAYAASGAPAAANGAGGGRHTLKLAVAVDGQPAWLHATACLKPGEDYTLTATATDRLPPWHGRFSVGPAAGGMLEVKAELDGGSLENAVTPRVITRPDQTATIIIGNGSAGKRDWSSAHHMLKLDLTPSVGC